MVSLKINGKEVQVEKGTTILEAAKKVNINIPTLCYMKMIDGQSQNCKGTCRVCAVEIEGKENLAVACSESCREGMSVLTNSPKAKKARKTIVELLLSNHPNDCLKCEKNTKCELQTLAAQLMIDKFSYEGEKTESIIDNSNPSIVRDMNKCILCRRCVTACSDVQNTNVLTLVNRGFNTVVGTAFDEALCNTNCTYCGQCVAVCPTGALTEVMDYKKIEPYLGAQNKCVMVQVAPAVRVALCEEFGASFEELTTGKMVAALKALNFNYVFDTNFSADLTIMEEANEFIDRFTKGEDLPLITSCCPAWVRFAETKYPELLKHVSSCKSPQQMFGAVCKNYLPKVIGIEKENILSVAIMPCIAKKYEAKRDELKGDVDIVLTTRELGKMIKEAGIDILNIEEESFDDPLGLSSGAGVIFGTSGGVMEAALRTAAEWITGETIEKVDFELVRGLEGVKEGIVKLNGKEIKIAVASSLKNAKTIMDDIKNGVCKYDFIEIMACPGGCIDGGGQPYIKSNREILNKRMEGLYKEDSNSEYRKSHENPFIKKLYEDFLEKPNSHIAHELLHTKSAPS
ncbi:MAG: NADH-dependent [FeFe] hydrogenase, group A6 [Clostridium sp.]